MHTTQVGRAQHRDKITIDDISGHELVRMARDISIRKIRLKSNASRNGIGIVLMCAGQVTSLIRIFVAVGWSLSEGDAGKLEIKRKIALKLKLKIKMRMEMEMESTLANRQDKHLACVCRGQLQFMGIVSCRVGPVRLCVRICIIVLHESFEGVTF